MKALLKHRNLGGIVPLLLVALLVISGTSYAQEVRKLQYQRPAGWYGLNIYEPSKDDDTEWNGKIKVQVGGDFAIQFQGLSQESASGTLSDLGGNFNLPTANLNLNVQLHDGVLMHLRTYLSARHHEEAWVKGGFIQIDKLDFIKEGFAESFMDVARFTVGLDEINYGDNHFQRSDNARAIYNPFVGNYIMDAFTTEAFGEVTLMPNNFLVVLGVSNGKLNQSVITDGDPDNKLSIYGKLGFDKQFNDDLRFRVTGSVYSNQGTSTGTYLYGGDRGGGRYYGVFWEMEDGGSDFEPRFNPRFRQLTSWQIAPFLQYGGLEVRAMYENIGNSDDQGGGSFDQFVGEVLYRFGSWDQLYIGGRYNTVSGSQTQDSDEIEINRLNIGGGWFLTKNVLAKIEYVNQNNKGDGYVGTKYEDGSFDGIVIEAVIGF